MVAISNVNDALPLGKAILDGGLNIIEVTFQTKVASECIKILSETYRNLIVGAGTVLSIGSAKKFL